MQQINHRLCGANKIATRTVNWVKFIQNYVQQSSGLDYEDGLRGKRRSEL